MADDAKRYLVRKYLESLGIDLSVTPSDEERPKKVPVKQTDDKWWRSKQLAVPICRPQPRHECRPVITRVNNGRIPSRLEYLSRPRRDYSDDMDLYNPTTPPHGVYRNADVNFSISKRLQQLAKPRPDIPEEIVRKKYFKSREQWAAYVKKLRVFAAPRRELEEELTAVRKKAPLYKIMPRLKELSKPANRPLNNNERSDEEMFTVNAAALKYKASDRIIQLSMHKPMDDEALKDVNYDPRKRLLNAKKYVISERVKELAQPIHRITPKKDEVKEDAFNVSKRALKARCSKRLKKLAQPVVRD